MAAVAWVAVENSTWRGFATQWSWCSLAPNHSRYMIFFLHDWHAPRRRFRWGGCCCCRCYHTSHHRHNEFRGHRIASSHSFSVEELEEHPRKEKYKNIPKVEWYPCNNNSWSKRRTPARLYKRRSWCRFLLAPISLYTTRGCYWAQVWRALSLKIVLLLQLVTIIASLYYYC